MPPRFVLQPEQVEDESLKPIQYLTPGLLGWAVATGAHVRRRADAGHLAAEEGATPAAAVAGQHRTVVGARVGVSVAVALVQTAIFIGVASLPYFGLQLSDYWWMAIPLLIAGTLAFLAIGLLAGSFAKTPEAASAVANLIVLPMAFLSGAFFPLQGAPAWLETLSQALPLRHLVDGMLAVMVRGEARPQCCRRSASCSASPSSSAHRGLRVPLGRRLITADETRVRREPVVTKLGGPAAVAAGPPPQYR